jgi:hypothetical protein
VSSANELFQFFFGTLLALMFYTLSQKIDTLRRLTVGGNQLKPIEARTVMPWLLVSSWLARPGDLELSPYKGDKEMSTVGPKGGQGTIKEKPSDQKVVPVLPSMIDLPPLPDDLASLEAGRKGTVKSDPRQSDAQKTSADAMNSAQDSAADAKQPQQPAEQQQQQNKADPPAMLRVESSPGAVLVPASPTGTSPQAVFIPATSS